MLVSVIIPNYNYGEFIGQAIDSALALDWPRVEVIVVDDGSTDHSRSVIEGYGERITAIFQSNGGQRAAYNAGFARSHGEAVIFLDSDDLLDPSVARELSTVWRPGVSKVQFQMKIIDAQGHATGALLPQYHVVPTPEQIRRWATTAAAYPAPPGSANAYARSYLSRLFPLIGEEGAADSYCLAPAPFLGDVLTIAKPLVSYRIHGRNNGAQTELDRTRFSKELSNAQFRFGYARRLAREAGRAVPERALRRSLSVLPYRLASLQLLPERHPISGDSRRAVLADLVAACFVPQGVPLRSRAALLLWATSVTCAPPALAEQFVLWRFSSAARPRVVKRLLRVLRITKRHRAS